MLVCNCTLSGDACLSCPNFIKDMTFEKSYELIDKYFIETPKEEIEKEFELIDKMIK